jgi:hypothetical protein
MILPACYLYRHYLEIEMKYLLDIGERCKLIRDKATNENNLHRIWNKLKALIVILDPNEPMDELNAMESVVLQFHSVDETGQEFRYPELTNGARSLARLPTTFSSLNVKAAMQEAHAYLDRVKFELHGCFEVGP